jgi:TIR domain-containing protein
VITSPIEIFLSHANKDKKIAKKLADELNKYGLKIFVAHENIEVGAKWESILFNKIKECDLFVALISENFHNAQYTDHEVGIAYGLNKLIFPIRVDDTIPYGFMSKFQAKKISIEMEKDEITKLFFTMVSKSDKGTEMINKLIEEFEDSKSFDRANYNASILSQYSEFSSEQINRIAYAFLHNDQINGGFTSEPWCVEIIKENWRKLDKKLRDVLEERL